MDHTQPHRQGETDNGQGTGHEGVSDEALLDRYRAGERLAIRTIIERYHDDLMRFLLRLVGDLAGAEDVFQETFLQVHISLERFDTERRFKPWLFTIAANKARDLLRRRARRFALDLSAPIAGTQGEATYIDLLEVPTEPPGRRLDDEERSVLVQRALDRMPLPLREILLLAYFQRLSYALIADELGIPLGTVKSRLHSAVAAFARRWRDALSEATEAPAPRRAPP